jgi:hypothetical protein
MAVRLFAVFALGLIVRLGAQSPELATSDSILDAKVAGVLPTAAEEQWLLVPWRLNLAQARIQAQKSGKPLFLWVMDGHPLGCT